MKGAFSTPAKAHGFTLLEMLVVLGIMALVAGLGFPAVQRGIAGARHRLAISQVEAALIEARAEAIRSGGPVTFRPPDADATVWRGAQPPRLVPQERPLVFFPDGSATGGEIALEEQDARMTWRVRSADGRAETMP